MAWTDPTLTATLNYYDGTSYYNDPIENCKLHLLTPVGQMVRAVHINDMRWAIHDWLEGEVQNYPRYYYLGYADMNSFHTEKRNALKVFFNVDQTEYNANNRNGGEYRTELEETVGEELPTYYYNLILAGGNWWEGTYEYPEGRHPIRLLTTAQKVRNGHLYELRKAIEVIECRCIDNGYPVPEYEVPIAEWMNSIDPIYSNQTYKQWDDIVMFPKFKRNATLISYGSSWDDLNDSRIPTEVRILHINELRAAIDNLARIAVAPMTIRTHGSKSKALVLPSATIMAHGSESRSKTIDVAINIHGADSIVKPNDRMRPRTLTATKQ